jgi:hypothetical protein
MVELVHYRVELARDKTRRISAASRSEDAVVPARPIAPKEALDQLVGACSDDGRITIIVACSFLLGFVVPIWYRAVCRREQQGQVEVKHALAVD